MPGQIKPCSLSVNLKPLAIALACQLALGQASAMEWQVAGKGEIAITEHDTVSRINANWFERGTGQLAYPQATVAFGPQYLSVQADTDSDFSFRLNTQWHRQPEAGLGVTEGWINWAPLPVNGYRLRARVGAFYPQLSLENTDTAWTSPYSSTFSAINSWVAEEVRTKGAEFSISRPGRFFQSEHSWTLAGSLFQGNDPAGTILAWRGFALHNLQTGLGERVNFARYPSLQQEPLTLQSAWVEPVREVDNRTGFYIGAHWQYRQHTQIRAYYYDNNADPQAFRHQQYAWHTRFSSVAAQHVINDNWQLVAQWLDGRTQMGQGVVDNSFTAWFVLANWQKDGLSATLRFDKFAVDDNDNTVTDDNNGDGSAVLLAIGYQLTEQLKLSAEHVRLSSTQHNRAQQWPWPAKQDQQLSKFLLTWRW